jgi:hypothetical protein
MRLILRLAFLLFLACFASFIPRASAQATTGSIYGQILDPSSAVVAGASVTARSQATGVVYSATSDGLGNYSIYGLPPGLYEIAVQKEGFDRATIGNVRLTIDQKQLLNFSLKIGAVSTIETVTSAPTLLQTQTSETGEVIQSHDILNLPLEGRTFYTLVGLTAGVTGGSGNTNSFNFSVNGQREYSNSVQIDGVESTTNRTQDITATPSVDAIEEFKVATSGYSAEFGRSAGGEVSIQTKGGTNSFHGDAYEFFRPNFTAARDYGFLGTTVPKPILKQHNYGGTLGGPIIRNKTFFFVSYEGTTNSNAANYLYSVPPISQISALPDGSVDLSKLIDPLAGSTDSQGNVLVPAGQIIPIFDPAVSFNNYGGVAQQFPGNIIPASEVSKAGLNTLLKFFPAPNLPGIKNGWFDNFQVHSPSNLTNKQGDARLDHNFSEKDRLAFVFHINDGNQLITGPFVGKTVVPEAGDNDFGNHQDNGSQEYSVSETHLFNTRVINDARFGYTRYHLNQYPLLQGQDIAASNGVGNVNIPGFSATYGYPYIQLYSGYFTGGSTYKPFYIQDHNWQIADSLIWSSAGKHDFKFGGDFRRLNSFPNFSLFPTGYEYYGAYFSPATSDPTFGTYFNPFAWFPNGGADIADLLVGIPFQHDMGLQLTSPHTQSWEMHFYAQDNYKITPRLTLNYGLRYEYQAPYNEAHNFAANYDPKSDSMLLAGRGSNSAGLMNSRWTNFAPRVGFAYQITPKTVLRGGWGLFFSPENDAREDILTKNYPFAELSKYQNYYYNGPCVPGGTQTVCDGIYNYQLDQGLPRNTVIQIPTGASSIPTTAIPNGTLLTSYYVDPKIKTGYSELFNLALQRELGSNFTLEAAFVGSKSHRLSYLVGDLNFDPATGGDGFITPNLGKLQYLSDSGWAQYHSLQVKLTKRVSQNLNFLASYTYAHNIDNGPAPFNLGVNSNYPQDPHNLGAEIASSDSDIRHNFVFSGVYQLPFGRGQAFFGGAGRAANLLVGGWQINGILTLHTGTPINIVRGASLTTCPGVRPDLVGDPYAVPPNGILYFNPKAFDVSKYSGSSCAPGTLSRNYIRGQSFKNLDASIFKNFDITERVKLQTRLEAFNTTNTPHFAGADGVYTDGTFGQINPPPSGSMRVVQLAAKVIF